VKITPSDLRKQAEALIASGRMPTLDELLQAVFEARRKYVPQILTKTSFPQSQRKGRKTKGETMNYHAIQQVFGAVGGVVVLYAGVRVAATVVDILNRWKRSRAGDPKAWEV